MNRRGVLGLVVVGLLSTACTRARLLDECLLPMLQASNAPEAGVEWVVFVSARTGDGDIYAVQPESGELRRLTMSWNPEATPRYDPARRRVVHQRFTGDRVLGLLMVGHEVVCHYALETPLAWSPRGDQAVGAVDHAFIGRHKERWEYPSALRFAAVDLDGIPAVPRLTRDQMYAPPDGLVVEAHDPAWSPHGTMIVYAREFAGSWDLFTLAVEPAGRTPRRVTFRGERVGRPSWSPDGRRIAFETRFGGDVEIAVLDLVTGGVRRLTERSGPDRTPAWSLDGERIVFAAADEVGNSDLWVVDAKGGPPRRLTNSRAWDGDPVVVPEDALPPTVGP